MAAPKSIDTQQAADYLDRHFRKIQAKRPSKPLQVKIVSQKLGLDYSFPEGSSGLPWHVASIGKVFTAVLIQILAKEGKLSIQDPIDRFFMPGELERLFVYKNKDFSAEVTVDHLLGHTSGIADYFEGKTTDGRNFIKEIISNPNSRWTPQRLIEFTRDHQTAVAVPGQVFNYSDTGYILLGQLIEKVSGKSFDKNLEHKFFQPLEMRDSYLMFFSQPRNQPVKLIQPIWFNGVEVSKFESLSCDWAGGGIVTTTEDLVKFSRALREGRLIQEPALAELDAIAHKFRQGIYYGRGMMEIRFKDFFFLLGGLPRVKGHIGILATHMFYDPLHEAHIVLNFGDTSRMGESFRSLIEIESTLMKMNRPG
jgi:D-alanyl-D-alanine carboxypeptidase